MRMADYGFSADNLMRALPAVLREDEKMRALAQAVAEALSDERTRTRGINMYARIMTLPNGLLDILAHDFKVDWWDTDMTLLQKRRVLAASWAVHRTLGTAGAVKTALSSVFAGAEVREWYWLCNAGVYTASIMSNGDIAACLDIERRPETIQGNIRTDRLRDVWDNRFELFRHDLSDLNDECRSCEHARFCRGDAHHSWDYDGNRPMVCLKGTLF